jgi:hypothetical protein
MVGAGLSLAILVAYAWLLHLLRGSPVRAAASRPLFVLSDPALSLGEHLFGQAPIAIFVVLGLYWAIIGMLVGLIFYVARGSRPS